MLPTPVHCITAVLCLKDQSPRPGARKPMPRDQSFLCSSEREMPRDQSSWRAASFVPRSRDGTDPKGMRYDKSNTALHRYDDAEE